MIRWLTPLLVLTVLLSSMGAPEKPSWTGQLAVKGNEPFTFLALTDKEGRQWRLAGDSVKDLRQNAQGRWVKVSGKLQGKDVIVVETWAWAPGEKTD